MTRGMGTGSLLPLMIAGTINSYAIAEVAQDPIRSDPRAWPGARTEWAIAPERAESSAVTPSQATELPEGTLLQEETSLPAGTLLPGGAILPETRVAPEATVRPAGASAAGPPTASRAASGVTYISGGVGTSEREEMELVKSKYNLRLLFAMQGSGVYLAAIRVRIEDGAGERLLDAVSRGPWLFANLPPGRYLITADNAGRAQTREVRVPAAGATQQDFYWTP